MDLSNSPIAKLKEKKGQAHTPTISTPFSIEPKEMQQTTTPQTQQQAQMQQPIEQKPSEATINKGASSSAIKSDAEPKQNKGTTNKGIKEDTTRYTIQIKKDHLEILKALSFSSNKKQVEILTELLDKAYSNIKQEKIQEALKKYREATQDNLFN